MYAIVEIAGQQFKVTKDQKVFVHRLAEEVGAQVSFDRVLLLDDGQITIGAPAIKDASVMATVLSHLKGDKVIVFKKRRRKGYEKKNGHRQSLTQIKIDSIGTEKVTPKKVIEKKVAIEEIAPKTDAKPTAEKTVKKAPAKKVTPKKPTTKE